MNFIKTIGRKGKGLGEFINISVLEIDKKDNLITFDSGNKRISVFDNNGKIKFIHKTVEHTRKIHSNKNSTFYIEHINIGASNIEGKSCSKLYKYTADFKVHALIDTLCYKTDIQISEPVRTNLPIPFCGSYMWAIDKYENVFKCLSNQDIIEIKNSKGVQIDQIELNILKLQVKEDDKIAFLNSLGFYEGTSSHNSVPQEIMKQIKFPRYKNMIKSIGVFKNQLFVEVMSENRNELKWLFINEDWTITNSLSLILEDEGQIISYCNNSFFIVNYDDDGFPLVVKHSFY